MLDIACGIGNMINNKGAICALLRMKNSKTSGCQCPFGYLMTRLKKNADYARITQAIINKLYQLVEEGNVNSCS